MGKHPIFTSYDPDTIEPDGIGPCGATLPAEAIPLDASGPGEPAMSATMRLMVNFMRERVGMGPVTAQDLIDEGFDRYTVEHYGEAAAREARVLFHRHDDTARRELRTKQGVAIVAELMPRPDAISAKLRKCGYTAAEVGELLPDIVTRAADQFAGASAGA